MILIKKYFLKENDFKDKNIEIFFTGINTSISQRIFKIKKFIKSKNFVLYIMEMEFLNLI